MTKINIFKNKDGSIVKYVVDGHTGYDSAGKDILCAAVSILTQTALNALNEVCGIDEELIDYTVEDEQGYLDVCLPDGLSNGQREKADIVLQTMIVGLKGLQEIYPEYITLEYGEVWWKW